jgi:hypothetical protein
VDIDESDSIL